MIIRLTIVALALLLGACSVIQPPARPALATYMLRLNDPAVARLDPQGAVLIVDETPARAGLDTPRMVYLRRPHAFDHFAQSQWADNPSKLLHTALIVALEASGQFAAVVSNGAGVHAPLRLDTELLTLEQDFTVTPSRMRLALRAQLIDTARAEIRHTQVYSEEEPCPTEDAYGGVIAANRILDRLLPRIAADIAARAKP